MPKRKLSEKQIEKNNAELLAEVSITTQIEKKVKITDSQESDKENVLPETSTLPNSQITSQKSNTNTEKTTKRIISWNVNGARAVVKKADSLKWIQDTAKNDDVIALCFQETKCDAKTYPKELNPSLDRKNLDKYLTKFYLNSSNARKGYSGTCILTKEKPISNKYGMGFQPVDIEGRVITVEYETFFLVTAYVPNSMDQLRRLDERTKKYEPKMRKFLNDLDAKKPVIYCGDLNVACSEIELANPKSNYNKTSGYTQAEIDQFHKMKEECKLVDVFRHFYPDKKKCYTYWGYRGGARARNVGWRLDYFMVSERFMGNVKEIIHHTDVLGSDHCPIELVIEV